MKLKFGLLILVGVLFSCQNEVEDNRLDWVKEIDKSIEKYDETAKMYNSVTKSHEKFEGRSTQAIFNENEYGVYKVIFESDVLGLKVSNKIYMRGNNIIFCSKKGYSLTNRQQAEDSQTILLSYKRTYFKSRKEAYIYEKRIDSLGLNFKDSYDSLDNIKFNEYVIKNSEEKYDQVLENVEEINKELR